MLCPESTSKIPSLWPNEDLKMSSMEECPTPEKCADEIIPRYLCPVEHSSQEKINIYQWVGSEYKNFTLSTLDFSGNYTLIVHDWKENFQTGWVQSLKKLLSLDEPYLVDWSGYSSGTYLQAGRSSILVG